MFFELFFSLLNHCKEVAKSFKNSGQSKKVCYMKSISLHITHFSSLAIPKIFSSFLVTRTREAI